MSLTPETAAKVERCQDLLAAKDPALLEAVLALPDHDAATAFAEIWIQDDSRESRNLLVCYLDQPLETFGQEPIVKRMFKHAEQQRDHEVMAAFLVAFDRLVRRSWRQTWDYSTFGLGQTPQHVERLRARANRMPLRKTMTYGSGKHAWQYRLPVPADARLFTHRTRYYLRRRAWRYFRQLGYQQPEQYLDAVCSALIRYRDADLAQGENILDCWGLMHLAFGEHPGVDFNATHAQLNPGTAIADLTPAPCFPELWKSPAAFEKLRDLLIAAQSHLVRRWAVELLRSEHATALAELELDFVLKLVRHKDPTIHTLGAELLPGSVAHTDLSLEAWLQLLPEDNPALAAQLCELIGERFNGGDVPIAQAIGLTLQRDPSIANLGLKFLQKSELARTTGSEHLSQLASLAEAQCDAVIPRIVRFALVGIARISETAVNASTHDATRQIRDAVLAFFEAPRQAVRAAAIEWLEAHAEHPLIRNDGEFWQRVLETPFDELRLRLVSIVDQVAVSAEVQSSQRAAWRQVLINIHRGSRLKPFVIDRLRDAVAARPQSADVDLRALALAARSIRAPERRQALAALVQLYALQPEVRAAIDRELPELKIDLAGECAGSSTDANSH